MHIEVADGILPLWIWLPGYIAVVLFLLIIVPGIKKEVKKTPLVAMLVALCLLAMSIPLGLPIHLNLMILIGLLIGIRWSLIIAFALNFILASFGHGGLTIVGLNTLLLWQQSAFGVFLFRFLRKHVKRVSLAAGISVFFSLFCSFFLLVGLVAVSQIDPVQFSHYLKHLGYVQISLKTFIILSLPVSFFGICAESLVTGFIVKFIKRVNPSLIKV